MLISYSSIYVQLVDVVFDIIVISVDVLWWYVILYELHIFPQWATSSFDRTKFKLNFKLILNLTSKFKF